MRNQENGIMQMLSQLMGLASAGQQMDSDSMLAPLKAQYLQQQIREQELENQYMPEQQQAQGQYHKLMSMPQAVMGMQGAGYGPEEVRLAMQKLFGLGDYGVEQAGRDYVRRMMPKESSIFDQLGGQSNGR